MVRWVGGAKKVLRFESACDEDEDKQNEANQTPAVPESYETYN